MKFSSSNSNWYCYRYTPPKGSGSQPALIAYHQDGSISFRTTKDSLDRPTVNAWFFSLGPQEYREAVNVAHMTRDMEPVSPAVWATEAKAMLEALPSEQGMLIKSLLYLINEMMTS